MTTPQQVLSTALLSSDAQRAVDTDALAALLTQALNTAGMLVPPPPVPCSSLGTDTSDTSVLLRCDLDDLHAGDHSNAKAKTTWTDTTAAGVLRGGA